MHLTFPSIFCLSDSIRKHHQKRKDQLTSQQVAKTKVTDFSIWFLFIYLSVLIYLN